MDHFPGKEDETHECMRVQGIGYRRVGGLGANKIREMVGNSMHVGTVAAVVRLLIQMTVGFDIEPHNYLHHQKACALRLGESASTEPNPQSSKRGGAKAREI